MGGKKEPNTIIGGIGGAINTKALLATKLGIPESIIRKFEVVGSDVHCTISSNYSIPSSCFNSDLSISSYHDFDGRVTIINGNAFLNCTSLESVTFYNVEVIAYAFEGCVNLLNWTGSVIRLNQYSLAGVVATPDLTPINFLHSYSLYNTNYYENILPNLLTTDYPNTFRNQPNVTKIKADNLHTMTESNQSFINCPNLEEIDMKKLTYYGPYGEGTPNSLQSGFQGIKMGCRIMVNVALSPSILGYSHASLLWAKDNRSAIVEFYDDDVNYVSTL